MANKSAEEQGGQDQIVTTYVRRYLQRLHEQQVEFKSLAEKHGLHPSSLSSVRDGTNGVGAKLRPKYAKLLGFADEGALFDAAVHAYVLQHVMKAGNVDSLVSLDVAARAAAMVRLLSWVEESTPIARVKQAIDAEPDAGQEASQEAPMTGKDSSKRTKTARR